MVLATCAVGAVVAGETQVAGTSPEAFAATASSGPQNSVAAVPVVATGVVNIPWANWRIQRQSRESRFETGSAGPARDTEVAGWTLQRTQKRPSAGA